MRGSSFSRSVATGREVTRLILANSFLKFKERDGSRRFRRSALDSDLFYTTNAFPEDNSRAISDVESSRFTRIMRYYMDYKLCATNLVGPAAFARSRRAQIANPSGDVWVRLTGFTLDF